MIHIGDDNVLIIDSYDIDELESDIFVNLNSANIVMLFIEPDRNTLELVINNKIVCSLPILLRHELTQKLSTSNLFRDKFLNYISNTYYLKEESKNKNKSEITKDDFELNLTHADLFVKTTSSDIISIINVPGFKNENNETIPNKTIIDTISNGKIVIYDE